MTRLLLGLIAFYQRWISPALGPRCRFAPSCSSYAAEALRVHGLLRGSRLAVWRLLRCHPFHPGGHEPVPPARAARPEQGKMVTSSATSQPAPSPDPSHESHESSRAGAPT